MIPDNVTWLNKNLIALLKDCVSRLSQTKTLVNFGVFPIILLMRIIIDA